MKKVILNETGSVEKLEVVETSKPELKEGEVLVKIKATAVNFIDTIIREGNMPPGMMPELPFTPGVEGTGVIEDANGTELKVGQKVAFLGLIGASTYAQYAAVRADRLVVLSNNADLLASAVLPVNYVTAYHMIKNVAKAEAGKTVMVYAASGGVGTAVVQISKLFGLTVVALERRDEKLQGALDLGADFAINIKNENWTAEVKEKVGSVDYVFNPVAGDSVKDDLEVLSPLGHIVIFGLLGGIGESSLMAEAFKHFGKAPTITFSEIYATFTNEYHKIDEALKELYIWLDEGKINPIYSTLPLEEVQEAHRMIQAGEVKGKLLLINE